MVSEVNIVDEYCKDKYLESVSIIGRIDRLFLETIKLNLEKLNIRDITAAQVMIVYNIENQVVGVGDIKKLGYYKGMNVSYNINSLVKNNYLKQFTNVYDARCKFVQLSVKGLELHAKLDELFTRHVHTFVSAGNSVPHLLQGLTNLENFLTDLMRREANA